MIVAREVEGRVYVESMSNVGNVVSYTRWCEVLGEPGVDRKKRGERIALALRVLEAVEVVVGRVPMLEREK